MADTRHLMKRCGQRRSGERWYVRLRVPTDLRGRFGRARFIDRALHTGDLREAQRRRHAVVAGILADFERARSAPTLDEVAAAARRAEVGRAWAVWRDAWLVRGRHHVEEGLGVLLDQEFTPDEDGEHTPSPGEDWRQRARQALRRHGTDPAPEHVERVAVALLEAHVEVAEMVLEGREPPGLPSPRRSAAARPGGEPLSATAERYIADRMRDPAAAWTKQTEEQVRLSVRLFVECVEDAPLATITREHASAFLDRLGTLHRDFARRHETRGMAFGELVERFAGEPTLANRTLNRHAGALHSLFRWARRRGMYEGDNPFADQHRAEGRQGWLPFTTGELTTLFSGRLFPPEVRPERHRPRSALPWIVLVALFSGMRLNEIAGLRVADVGREDGLWFFDVAEYEGRRVKTAAAVRRVPVHSALARFGLLDYVAGLRGEGYLWPGLTPGGVDHKRGHFVSKRFVDYRRACGVKREHASFHSFRKNVVEALERARVHQSEIAQIIGHERGFTLGVYSPHGLDLAGRQRVVEAITYPGLDLSHLEGKRR